MLTNGGHQSLHHLCEDVSATDSNEAKRHLVEASAAFERLRTGEFVFRKSSCCNFRIFTKKFVKFCASLLFSVIALIFFKNLLEIHFRHPAWLTELRNRLLQGGDDNSTMDLNVASETQRTHRRTVSDIPMFDDDNVRCP